MTDWALAVRLSSRSLEPNPARRAAVEVSFIPRKFGVRLLLLLGRADREVDLALNAQGRQRGLGLLLPCRNSLALVKNLLAKQLQLFGRPLAAVRDMAHRADYQRTDEVCGDK